MGCLGGSRSHELILDLQDTVTTLRDSVAEYKTRLAASERSCKDAQERESKMRDSLAASSRRIEKLEAQVQELQDWSTTAENEAEVLHAQIKDGKAHHASVVERKDMHMEALQKEVASLERKLKRSEDRANGLQAQLSEATQHASTKSQAANLYMELIQSIQTQLEGASRPGSAASGASRQPGISADDQDVVRGAIEQLRKSQTFAASGSQMQFGKLSPPSEQSSPDRPQDGNRSPPRTSSGRLSRTCSKMHTMRRAGSRCDSAGHNEYHNREKGLGKPCLTMDMAAVHDDSLKAVLSGAHM